MILAVEPLKAPDGLMPWFELRPIFSLGKGSTTAPAVVSGAEYETRLPGGLALPPARAAPVVSCSAVSAAFFEPQAPIDARSRRGAADA